MNKYFKNDKFFNRYQFSPFGEYNDQLSNNGEKIILKSANNDTLILIDYADQYPWPASADGSGYSLVPKDNQSIIDQNNPQAIAFSKQRIYTKSKDRQWSNYPASKDLRLALNKKYTTAGLPVRV